MHDKVSSQQSHKVQDIVVCTCTVCGKVHTLKSFEVTGDLDGSRSQDSWLPKNHQLYPGSPRFIHWKVHFSGERGRALRAPRRPRRPRQPGDPRLSPLASEDIRNDDGKGPQPS